MIKRLLRRLQSKTRRPSPLLPEGLRVYAVGDIHGRYDLLRRLQTAILKDLATHPTERAEQIFLGDYVDRGPETSAVIEWLASPEPPELPRTSLLGNHEDRLIAFLGNPDVLAQWQTYGGLETLRSYGLSLPHRIEPHAFEGIQRDFRAALPQKHLRFLRELKEMTQRGDYLFAHAGVRPGLPLDQQDIQDLIWIRDEFLDYPGDYGAMVVHGHTPKETVDLRENRLGIDTGAYVTGKLTCAVLDNSGIRFLQTDKEAVRAFFPRDLKEMR